MGVEVLGEPVDPELLEADAAAQHEVDVALVVVGEAREPVGEVSLGQLLVVREAGGVVRRVGAHLQREGKEVVPYLVGRKAVAYYKFRKRPYAAEWSGFTDAPTFEHAREIADRITADFLKETEEGGNDEIHVVFTRFRSMVRQDPHVLRLLPLEVVEADDAGSDTGLDFSVQSYEEGQLIPEYEFEPSADQVLDLLLPKYVRNRIFTCLLSSAASELAARQRAMKSATDNASELIKKYERLANQARQAGITQEISEIVGGANALADAKKK